MNEILRWIDRHDSTKVLLVALASAPVMLLAMFGPGASFGLAAVLFLAIYIAGGYWIANWKWILLPLAAMLVELAIAIPLSLNTPDGGETPFSIVLEAPFWTGIPALIGASIGYVSGRGAAAAHRGAGRGA